MKTCPKCGADVEGLLYHCDCCRASLQENTSLFRAFIYELPQCLGLSSLVFGMAKTINPPAPHEYKDFLELVGFEIICYPDALRAKCPSPQKSVQVRYYPARKFASVRCYIDFDDFVYGSREEKANLVAAAFKAGLDMLQLRMKKYKHDVDNLIRHASRQIDKYLLEEKKERFPWLVKTP